MPVNKAVLLGSTTEAEMRNICDDLGIAHAGSTHDEMWINLLHGGQLINRAAMISLLNVRNVNIPGGANLQDVVDLIVASAPAGAGPVVVPPPVIAPPPIAALAVPPVVLPPVAPLAGAPNPAPANILGWYLVWDVPMQAAWDAFDVETMTPELRLLFDAVSIATCFALHFQNKHTAIALKGIKNVDIDVRLFQHAWPVELNSSVAIFLDETRRLIEAASTLSAGDIDGLRLMSDLRSVTNNVGSQFFQNLDLSKVAAISKQLNRFSTGVNFGSTDGPEIEV